MQRTEVRAGEPIRPPLATPPLRVHHGHERGDEAKLGALMGKILDDCGAAASAPLVVIGDRLGLYRAMGDGAPVTAAELAARTGTAERYVREWLAAQAAGGYVTYDGPAAPANGAGDRVGGITSSPSRPQCSPTTPPRPACWARSSRQRRGADGPRLLETFRTGEGVGWHEHGPELFKGTERFFRPVTPRISRPRGFPRSMGSRKAPARCARRGHRLWPWASTILMAQAYPNSQFFGFDYHAPSIEMARMTAEAGVQDRHLRSRAVGLPRHRLRPRRVLRLPARHGRPRRRRRARPLHPCPGRHLMIVEPFAHDRLENNLNPIGRVFYTASTMICTPASRPRRSASPSAPKPAKPACAKS